METAERTDRAPLAVAPTSDVIIEVRVPGILGGTEQLTYQELLAALALVEFGDCPAQLAVETAALADGWGVGVNAFGSYGQSRPRFHLDPRALERVVWAARQLAWMAPSPAEDGDEHEHEHDEEESS